MSERPQTPYEILGDDGIRELVHVFYDVMSELPLAAGIRAMHAEISEIQRWTGGGIMTPVRWDLIVTCLHRRRLVRRVVRGRHRARAHGGYATSQEPK